MKILWSLTTFLLFLLVHSGRAQLQTFNTENDFWYEGVLIDSDGVQYKGLINYNFMTELVIVKNENSSKRFTPANILSFSLSISEHNKPMFYSLPFDVEGENSQANSIFRVVYEGNRCAALAKYKMIIKDFDNNSYNSFVPNEKIEKIYERIFVLDKENGISPLLETIIDKKSTWYIELSDIRDNDLIFGGDTIKNNYSALSIQAGEYRFKDKGGLKKVCGDNYTMVNKYISEKELDIRFIDELIQVIEYYDKNCL